MCVRVYILLAYQFYWYFCSSGVGQSLNFAYKSNTCRQLATQADTGKEELRQGRTGEVGRTLGQTAHLLTGSGPFGFGACSSVRWV